MYEFTRQLTQVALSKVLPGAQTHCKAEVAPVTPFVLLPEPQLVHVPRPVALLYVLVEQAVHPPACVKKEGKKCGVSGKKNQTSCFFNVERTSCL